MGKDRARLRIRITGEGSPPPPVVSGAPFLAFSDLTSGPSTGNTDTSFGGQVAGEDGAYVTVWGNRLGSSQAAGSDIVINSVACRVIYWGAAIPPYSPANLVNGYHDMQCVIAQVMHSATQGAGTISVTVGGVASNTLPFTVRSGRIFYMTDTGSVSGDGTWQNPWDFNVNLNTLMNVAGDTLYLKSIDWGGTISLSNYGTPSAPYALVAYPGSTAIFGVTDIARPFFFFNGAEPNLPERYVPWWTLSKLTLRGAGSSEENVKLQTGKRMVGCKLGGNLDTGATGCVWTNSDQVWMFGNEFSDVGSGSDTRYHVVYSSSDYREISNGTRNLRWDLGEIPYLITGGYEYGWNYFHGNRANRAFNIYNQPNTNVEEEASYVTNGKVHHNVIVDQCGDGIGLLTHTAGENWVYSNVVVRAGKDVRVLDPTADNHAYWLGIHIRSGTAVPVETLNHVWFNTLIDCGDTSLNGTDTQRTGAIRTEFEANYTIDARNNIVYQSNGLPFFPADSDAPTTAEWSNNLWFGDFPAPVGTSNQTADPLFIATGANPDPRIRAGSPALGNGVAITAAFSIYDFDGRLMSTPPDIGAFASASLPAWIPAEGEWLYLGGAAGSTIDPDAMPPLSDANVYASATGVAGWLNWTDAAYIADVGSYGGYAVFLGGHNTTSDNSVKLFTFAENGTWAQRGSTTNNRTDDSIDLTFGEYVGSPTGHPCDAHTWGCTFYLPPANGGGSQGSLLLLSVPSPGLFGGGGSSQAHRFDFATNTWSRYGSNQHTSENNRLFADDGAGTYFVIGPNYIDRLIAGANPSWTHHNVTSSPAGLSVNSTGGNSCCTYWPEQNMLILLNATTTSWNVWGLDVTLLAAGTAQWRQLNLTEPQMPWGGPGWSWVPWLGKLLAWDHVPANATINSTRVTTTVRWATPPASNPYANAWTWSTESFTNPSGHLPPVWDTPQTPATYDRLHPIPSLKCLALCESMSAPMVLLRPRTT